MNKKEFLGASLHTGLKAKCRVGISNWEVFELAKIEYKNNYYGMVKFPYCDKELFYSEKYIHPILRPLSDLIKPIMHNGETFVPIAKLFKMPDSEVDIVSASEECVQFINKRTRCHYSFYVATIRLPEALMLIEWHFNLMDKSEPFIPVTEEFNPYK